MRQLFERFHADSPAAVGDARFEFFMRTIWPRVKDSVSRGEHEMGCGKGGGTFVTFAFLTQNTKHQPTHPAQTPMPHTSTPQRLS